MHLSTRPKATLMGNMVTRSGASLEYQMQRFDLFCATITSLFGTHFSKPYQHPYALTTHLFRLIFLHRLPEHIRKGPVGWHATESVLCKDANGNVHHEKEVYRLARKATITSASATQLPPSNPLLSRDEV